jgi:hypothetical protein
MQTKQKEEAMKFKLTNIKWDTDGERVKLPKSMIVECDDEEEAVDKASDETGWCILSSRLEYDNTDTIKRFKTMIPKGYTKSMPKLKSHLTHKLEIAESGNKVNHALKCMDCCEVIYDFDENKA